MAVWYYFRITLITQWSIIEPNWTLLLFLCFVSVDGIFLMPQRPGESLRVHVYQGKCVPLPLGIISPILSGSKILTCKTSRMSCTCAEVLPPAILVLSILCYFCPFLSSLFVQLLWFIHFHKLSCPSLTVRTLILNLKNPPQHPFQLSLRCGITCSSLGLLPLVPSVLLCFSSFVSLCLCVCVYRLFPVLVIIHPFNSMPPPVYHMLTLSWNSL